ncbi:MAG TPA: HIT domain-containing protein [Actinomycetota bacterium]|nr:HIT domain-containing protein [Actinomycetota bacterium]
MAFVSGHTPPTGCFLCEKGRGSPEGDEKDLVLARGVAAYALLNAFPYNTGHVMVAPYRHAGDLADLTGEELAELWHWVKSVIAAHRDTSRPDGFNVGINLGEAAGAGTPGHLHVHVVPRWGGDTNFMPVIADAKVLPEMLSETWRRLCPAIQEATG